MRITEDLIALVDEVAGFRIDHGAGLLASGLTSANLVALVARATDRWHVDIPVEALFHRGTIAGLADHVRTAMIKADTRGNTSAATPLARRGDTSSSGHLATGSAEERKAMRNRIRAAVGKIS